MHRIKRKLGGPAAISRLAFFTALMLSFSFNVFLIARRLHWPMPLTPWDAGMIADGWRALHHIPTYATDHATDMYGPLQNATSGLLFYLTGVNNFTLRIFELVCYCLASIILANAVAPHGWRYPAFALLTLANIRMGDYWVMPNPDGAALLFSVISLVLSYRNRHAWSAIALVIAFLYKQPCAVLALIPLLAMRPRPTLGAYAPLAAIAATVTSLRLFFPLQYHFAIVVPGQAPYIPYRFVKAPIDMLIAVPIVLLALATWVPKWDRFERWIVTTMAVSVVAGTLMASRAGGGWNSYMFFLVASLAFCCYRLPDLAQSLPASVAVLLTAFGFVAMTVGSSGEHQGDMHYHDAIALVRSLPGKIVCPEDPTIPMYAKSYLGTDINMEQDDENKSDHLPERTRLEVATADWVLTTDQVFGGKRLLEPDLVQLGFDEVENIQIRGSAYNLWERAHN